MNIVVKVVVRMCGGLFLAAGVLAALLLVFGLLAFGVPARTGDVLAAVVLALGSGLSIWLGSILMKW